MKDLIFYMVLFLAVAIYGVVHYVYVAKNWAGLGFVQSRGTVLAQSEPRNKNLGGSHSGGTDAVYDRTIRFTWDAKEHTVTFVEWGVPDDKLIGKEIDILINTKDISKSTSGNISKEQMTGLGAAAVGLIGCVVIGFFIYRRYTAGL